MSGNFWYAERSKNLSRSILDNSLQWKTEWKPALQLQIGCIELDLWFKTESECIEFIKDEILSAGVEG